MKFGLVYIAVAMMTAAVSMLLPKPDSMSARRRNRSEVRGTFVGIAMALVIETALGSFQWTVAKAAFWIPYYCSMVGGYFALAEISAAPPKSRSVALNEKVVRTAKEVSRIRQMKCASPQTA